MDRMDSGVTMGSMNVDSSPAEPVLLEPSAKKVFTETVELAAVTTRVSGKRHTWTLPTLVMPYDVAAVPHVRTNALPYEASPLNAEQLWHSLARVVEENVLTAASPRDASLGATVTVRERMGEAVLLHTLNAVVTLPSLHRGSTCTIRSPPPKAAKGMDALPAGKAAVAGALASVSRSMTAAEPSAWCRRLMPATKSTWSFSSMGRE